MNEVALYWFVANLFTIVILAFFSMTEMACVSFNTIRLQFYLSKGVKQAVWLNTLLHDPGRLFTTTLIGVNFATVMGSECSRQCYSALGWNPDWSPLTQVLLVVIIGELAPMFAARRYAEHVVMLGMPFLYLSAQVMRPLTWGVSKITQLLQFFMKGKTPHSEFYLSQEELLKVLEEKESDEFSEIAANIFKLRHLTAWNIMKPITQFPLLESNSTIKEMRALLKATHVSFFPIFHQRPSNIVGVALPRDMLRSSENQRVREYARTPWFVPYDMTTMDLLQRFRSNRQAAAVVINDQGAAIGIISLDTLIEEIISPEEITDDTKPNVVIDRTLPGDTTMHDFFEQFDVALDPRKELTLSELIIEKIGHMPDEGDSILVEPYELTVKTTTLMEIKEVSVSTKM